VDTAVERTVTQSINQAVNKAVPPPQYQPPQYQPDPVAAQQAAQLGGVFAGLTGAAQSFANEAARNIKICPACGAPCGAEMKFCNQCGGPLPEMTAAQGAVCQSCGMRNGAGTKFCSGCGAKLPGALAEETAAQARSEAALAQWESLLPQYPKWNLGGSAINIEQCGAENGYPVYALHVSGQGLAAALAQYTQLLRQSCFIMAGQYPSERSLFKRVNGVVYCFTSENAFDGGMDRMRLFFLVREPAGGFDYRAPAPQQKKNWKDMLGI
jgi:hypothetical protein